MNREKHDCLTFEMHYRTRGPFHKSLYERFLLYEFVEPVLKYRSNVFIALTNLSETGPRCGYESLQLLLFFCKQKNFLKAHHVDPNKFF